MKRLFGEVPQRHHLAVGADPEGQGEPGSEETSGDRPEEVARQRQGPSPGEVGTFALMTQYEWFGRSAGPRRRAVRPGIRGGPWSLCSSTSPMLS